MTGIVTEGWPLTPDNLNILGAATGFNVKAYGAVGDGATNDLAAIQATVDAATSGASILFPPGTYAVGAGELDVTKPLVFVGGGPARSILLLTGTIQVGSSNVWWRDLCFQGTTPASSKVLTTKSGAAGDYSNWRWERCRFVDVSLRITKIGRTESTGVPATTGTDLASGCQVVGCEFTGSQDDYVIEVGGQTDTTIERCHLHDYGPDVNSGEGVKVLAGSTGTRIVGCVCENGTRDGVDIYDSHRNTVIGNVFRACGVNGLEAKWQTTDANPTAENVIGFNRAEGCGSGFNLSVDHLTAIGNVAQGSTDVTDGFGFRVGPAFDDGVTASENVVLVGNIASGNASDGFRISGASRGVLVANSAVGNTGYGFSISSGTGTALCSFVGNSASGNTDADLNPSSVSPGSVILGNTFEDATYDRVAVLPNNVKLYARRPDNALASLLLLTTGGSLNIGETATISLINLLSSSLVDCFSKLRVQGELEVDGALNHDGTTVGFYGVAPAAKPTVTGSAGANAALISLLSALSTIGLITDSSS